MPNQAEHDTEYEAQTITQVKVIEEGYCEVTGDFGTLRVSLESGQDPPTVGEVARYFGRGMGYPVRGFAVEAAEGLRVYYYQTSDQAEAQRKQRLEEDTKKRVLDYLEKKGEYRARINALPAEFQDRINRFEAHCGGVTWMAEFLPYELFVAEEAVKLISYFGKSGSPTPKEFYDYPYEVQMSSLPDVGLPPLSRDHSGNTFGAALQQAQIYMDKPEIIPFAHAAIHGLIGCEKAGCWASRHGRTGEEAPV